MDLLLPPSLVIDEQGTQLRDLLASLTGFAVIEHETFGKAPNLRSRSGIDALWDVMCSRLINLITDAVAKVSDSRPLLLVKELIDLFMQTVQVYTLT
jgi:exocyst complex component 6